MGLILRVDGQRWRDHLRAVHDRHPGLVPVAKGNGYGFGLPRLARRAAWLGVDTLAVGTYEELPEVEQRFDGSLLVLTPWRPWNPAPLDRRVIHTVGRLEDLAALAALGAASGARPRVALERMTSMRRHGFSARQLRVAATQRGVEIAGVALHLPLAGHSHLPEVERLLNDVVSAGLPPVTVWVSHLSDDELTTLGHSYPELGFRPRIGTGLWLGDRGALSVVATVLDVHPVERGDVFGYRGRSVPRQGAIVVVSGGTAHGIGLEAPTGESTMRARAASVARGGLNALGLVRSPFTIDGKQRLFAEPPHMQASMLYLTGSADLPRVGQEIACRVRFTATDFDRIEIS